MLELITKAAGEGAVDDALTLPYALRQRSRQRVRLDSGREAALLLPPGTALRDGDRICAADGTAVRVHAAIEDVSVARTDDPLRLARACYHLGNRHVALQVDAGAVRYLPDHVLDDMVRRLGLDVRHEARSFEPERGAYQGGAHAHGGTHAHGEMHAHGETHSHGDHAHPEPHDAGVPRPPGGRR